MTLQLKLIIAVLFGVIVGFYLGYSAPVEIQVETWRLVNENPSMAEEIESIDCGWSGGYVSDETNKVEWFHVFFHPALSTNDSGNSQA